MITKGRLKKCQNSRNFRSKYWNVIVDMICEAQNKAIYKWNKMSVVMVTQNANHLNIHDVYKGKGKCSMKGLAAMICVLMCVCVRERCDYNCSWRMTAPCSLECSGRGRRALTGSRLRPGSCLAPAWHADLTLETELAPLKTCRPG